MFGSASLTIFYLTWIGPLELAGRGWVLSGRGLALEGRGWASQKQNWVWCGSDLSSIHGWDEKGEGLQQQGRGPVGSVQGPVGWAWGLVDCARGPVGCIPVLVGCVGVLAGYAGVLVGYAGVLVGCVRVLVGCVRVPVGYAGVEVDCELGLVGYELEQMGYEEGEGGSGREQVGFGQGQVGSSFVTSEQVLVLSSEEILQSLCSHLHRLPLCCWMMLASDWLEQGVELSDPETPRSCSLWVPHQTLRLSLWTALEMQHRWSPLLLGPERGAETRAALPQSCPAW